MSAQQDAITLDPDDGLRPVADLLEGITGRRPHPAMIWRARNKGTRAGRLPAIKIYGAWHTTRPALMEWLRRGSEVAPLDGGDDHEPHCDEATDRRLQAAGLL